MDVYINRCTGADPEKYQRGWLAATSHVIVIHKIVQGFYNRYHCHAGPETASGLHLENESMVGDEQKNTVL